MRNSIDENNKLINNNKQLLISLKSELSQINTDELNDKFTKLQRRVNELKTNIAVDRRSLKSDKEMLATIEDNYNQSINQTEPFSELIENNNRDIESKTVEKTDKLKERQKLALLKFMTDEDTVHKFVVSQFAKDINFYISKYLNAMGVNYMVSFDNDLTYTFTTPVGEMTYETFSSGEKMRLNIAISFAFRKLLMKYLNIDFNLLLIDEYMDSALDTLAISGIINLLNEIKLENSEYCIYIISHRSDILSELSTNSLIVKKLNGISSIETE